jgi:hypothetical protein
MTGEKMTDISNQSKQAMGLFLTPEWLHDFADMESAIKAAAESNFGIIIGFARHMRYTVTSPQVHDAVKAAVGISHRYGLKFAMDFDWAHWGGEFAEKNPEMAMWHIVPAESACRNGRFDFCIPYVDSHGPTVVAEISAVYGFDSDGAVASLGTRDYELQQESFTSGFPLPTLDDERQTSEYRRPSTRGYYLRLSGKVKNNELDKIRFYVAMRSYKQPDVAHPDYLQAQAELLDMYNDVPLDGVAWDEPGKGGSLKSYKAGRGFLSFFEQQCGYDLRTRLLELDNGMDATSLQTRRDYYQTLNEMNYQAQDEFNRKAKSLFGEDIFLGTHHTFSGMAMDLRCGCSDYFRLGKTLSAAFTDTGWDVTPHSETVYNYVLVDSLRKEFDQPLSYVNDWSWTPHTAWYDYYTRLKMLYRIEWFNIFLGRHSEGFPTFPWDSHWPEVGRNAGLLEEFREFISSTNEPQSEMAVWHSWEGPAYLESASHYYIRMWMTCNYNLSEESLKQGRFFDYASTGAIENGKVANGTINLPGGEYNTLVLPYAVIMTEQVWDKIRECVKAGVEVIFVGPPPSRLIDSGKDISKEFCELCGIEPTNFDKYDAWFKARKPIPSFTDWEPEKIDFRFPIALQPGSKQLFNDDNEAIGVRNNAVTWLTSPDPREQFFRHLSRPESDTPHSEHYGNGYSRILTGNNPDEFILVCVAPLHGVLHEQFSFDDLSFGMEGGRWAVLKISGRKIVNKLLDGKSRITKTNG